GLAAYDAERRPATAEIVRANRVGGPERVIDLVEERAPDGFERLEDIATEDELTAIVGSYQTMAGFETARASA
ncbi:MAG: flavin-dependent oxidoreductase, partial [Pseudomonadota bacterium]